MLCKRCMVVMKSGTLYENKKDSSGRKYRRYDKCPKCKDVVYNNAPNFQEIMKKETEKSRSK